MKSLRFSSFIILCALLAVSCSQPEPKEAVKKIDPVSTDHFFTVSAGGKTYRVIKAGMIDSAYFQSFLNSYYGKPAVFDTTYQLEVTSDSIPDRIHLSTKSIEETFVSVAQIYSNDTLIWSDTLKIKDETGRDYFGNDTTYEQLKPYTSFYLAFQRRLPTYYENGHDVNTEENRLFFFGMLENKQDSVYWKERLKTYTGTLIGNLFLMDGDVFIWDEPHRKFILFYAP